MSIYVQTSLDLVMSGLINLNDHINTTSKQLYNIFMSDMVSFSSTLFCVLHIIVQKSLCIFSQMGPMILSHNRFRLRWFA